MGFGDVKFMACIGAFVGWQGALFSLMASAVIGEKLLNIWLGSGCAININDY